MTDTSLESSICGLFGDIFSFKVKLRIYEKLAKTLRLFYETFGLRSKLAGVTCARHGPLLVLATARRDAPRSQITLGRLVIISIMSASLMSIVDIPIKHINSSPVPVRLTVQSNVTG